jgi:hypothetical protein
VRFGRFRLVIPKLRVICAFIPKLVLRAEAKGVDAIAAEPGAGQPRRGTGQRATGLIACRCPSQRLCHRGVLDHLCTGADIRDSCAGRSVDTAYRRQVPPAKFQGYRPRHNLGYRHTEGEHCPVSPGQALFRRVGGEKKAPRLNTTETNGGDITPQKIGIYRDHSVTADI